MNAYQKFNQLARQVTGEVIAELEKGKAIWQKPWSGLGLPKNYFSGRPYEGFNAFYLHHLTEKHGYTAPYFLTFRQARELGGHVRKGQKGTAVVYWKVLEGRTEELPTAPGTGTKEGSYRKFIPFLWTVFNIDQVEGVDFRLPEFSEKGPQQVIESCQQVVEGFPSPRPCIRQGGNEAWYAPALDKVQVPELRCFTSAEAYHATLFHELIHATGHPSRLGRFTADEAPPRFGDEAYSREELVAEMGASFLCAFTGIREQVFQNSVAYLQGWVNRLRQDNTLVIYAAARAFKAASYILDLKASTGEEVLTPERAAA